MPTYKLTTTALWLSIGASLAYSATHSAHLVGIVVAGVLSSLLVAWIIRHPDQVKEIYLERKQKGAEYRANSGYPNKQAPNPLIILAIILLVGVVLLFAAFAEHSGEAPRGLLRQALYSIIGSQGTATVSSFLAAHFLFYALEFALGMRLDRND